jgi:GPH family glycoside/pentoside/hexuronide:cation symporter
MSLKTNPSKTVEPPAGSPVAPASGNQASLRDKLAWSVSTIGEQLTVNGISSMAFPVFNLTLGIDPRWLGWGLALPRILDAIVDPAIGNYSDSFESRWGRRRPFMFVGALIMSLAFMLIWLVPTGLSQVGIFAYFLSFTMLAYFGYAVFAIPRNALGIELSTDYFERTRIFALNTFFAYSATLLMGWMYSLSIKTGRLFEGDVLLGARVVMVGVGVVMLLCTVIPAIIIREKPTKPESHPKMNVFAAFKMTMQNRPFMLFFFMALLLGLAMGLTSPMMLYIGIDYIAGGNRELGADIGGVSGLVGGLTGLAMAPVVVLLAGRLGKKNVLLLGQGMAILGFLSSWWLFTPQSPYLQVIFPFLITVGLSPVYSLGGAVLADICDIDELKYGMRREGMFGAVYQFLNKVTGSCVTIIAGYLLVMAGYVPAASADANATPVMQPPDVLFNMRLLFIVCSVLFMIGTMLLTAMLPISEKESRRVRAAIDARDALKNSPEDESSSVTPA